MPQALSVCDLHIFPCWLISAGKRQDKNIQGCVIFYNSPEAAHWLECGHQWMLITKCGVALLRFWSAHECSVKEFQEHIHTLNELKTKEIHWLMHKRQRPKAHTRLTVVLSPSCRLLRMAVSLAWGEMIQCRCYYSTVRQETLWLPYALSSRMESIKEWE